ncbi:MAG: hypothetical protein JF592_07785 [Microbacterium sp.]|uniref:SpaA isopeptide-forming pilin-related protein n=1 Tax=Microbacterium sp. TaxID=51671 RepID=UPI001D20B68E|nr:SpaA isopeptide-forming pilin-related protein [Microbacterium sp.]MBW8762473.1 hypothetical protein [Microbacterium sp.]
MTIRGAHVQRARTTTRGRGPRWGRGLLSAVTGLTLVAAAMLGTAQIAAAAPTVTHSDAISNLAIEKTDGTGPVAQWEKVRITGDWSVPTGSKAGDTFGMSLPEEFSRTGGGAFDITDPATGVVLAQCQVADGSGPELVCTLTQAVEGMENPGGSFWLEVAASRSTTSTTVEFDLGGRVEIVELPGGGGITPEDLTEAEQPYKYGGPTAVDGRLEWVVGIPSSAVLDGGFVVKDSLDQGLENHHYTGEIRLLQRPVVDGVLVGDWSEVAATQYQVVFAPDGRSFEFTASGLPESGLSYRLLYFTQADDMVLPGDVFGNKAIVNTSETSANVVIAQSGGGSGTGDQYTRFEITKVLTGAAADEARGATFTVRYSVKGSDEPSKTLSVPVGQAVRSDRVPLGSTFIIEEVDLPVIDGVTWGDWIIEGEGVVETGDGRYEVTPATSAGVSLTLTNEANATPVDGSLSWEKVDHAGAALAGSEWLLSGPLGDITVVDGGQGDEAEADGILSVSGLPAGTYTLTETKAPQGYERTDETFTATIDAEHQVVSFGQIVNEKTPAPVVTPTPPATPFELALTGGGDGRSLALIAFALLLSGTAVTVGAVVRRRVSASKR